MPRADAQAAYRAVERWHRLNPHTNPPRPEVARLALVLVDELAAQLDVTIRELTAAAPVVNAVLRAVDPTVAYAEAMAALSFATADLDTDVATAILSYLPDPDPRSPHPC